MIFLHFHLVDNSTEVDSKGDKAKNRHDIPKGMLPIYVPADAFPLIIKGHLLKRKPDGSVIDVISKKNLVTAIRKGAPKEDLASMVLVNPSPELNLDLTENEAQEINNRHKTLEMTDIFNNETSVKDFPEAANAVTHENISASPVNKTVENSNAASNDINFNDTGFYNSKSTNNKNTVSSDEVDQSSTKTKNLNNTRNLLLSTGIDQSNSLLPTRARSSKESDKLKSSIDYNRINYIQSQPSSRTNGVFDNKQTNKEFSTTNRIENTTSNKSNLGSDNANIYETNQEKMNNNETSNPLAYNIQNNIKSISKGDSSKLSNKTFANDKSQTKSDKDSGETNIKTQTDKEASLQNKVTEKENNFEENHHIHNSTDPANPEEEADQPLSQEQTYEGKNLKGTDSKISNGVGSLSQTLELHSGNGKVHVSPHHVDHQSLFSGKLSDRFKMHHLTPMFGGRTEITKAPLKINKNQTSQAITKSILNHDHPFSNKTSNLTLEIDRTGKELDELYKKAHRTLASNSAANKASNGKKQLKNNVYRSQDKTVSSGNKTTNLQKIQEPVKVPDANHSKKVEKNYSNHTDMSKNHNKVFQVDNFVKANDFGIYENDHGDHNPIISDTATSKLRNNFIPSQTKNVRPTNRNINSNITQYGHNVMLVFSKGVPTQLQTKNLPGNFNLLSNTTALKSAHKNISNKSFRNVSLNSNLNRNSCKTPVVKTAINIQCVDNDPIKQNATTPRKNHELPEVRNARVATNNVTMTGEKPTEHSVNGAGISNHKVHSNGAGLQKHQTSGVGTGLKTEVVNNSTRSVRKYNTSNENPSKSFKNDSKSSLIPFRNNSIKVIQGPSNIKPIKLPASKNFNKAVQSYKEGTNSFPEFFPNHGVTNSTTKTIATTKTIDNISGHSSKEQKNKKSKNSWSEVQNQSKLYSYTLKNVTAILDLPEPRINKDKIGENGKGVQIHESNERKEKFDKSSHAETGKRKNLDSVQNHEINKNLDNDISSLVRAVEDVSKDAADLAEEFNLNDDAKLSKLEDIVNTDYNENFLNNPAVLKTFDRKALQARKDEIDRLLKLLDKEEHETALTRTRINKYRKKLGLSGNEDAEINELTRIFNKIDAREDDKVSEKRSHNRRPKRVKIVRYIPTNLEMDKSVSFYRRPVDDEHPYDIELENDEHSITPIKGNINLNGHRLNFISEESLTNDIKDQSSYDKKKHKNRKRRLYNLTSSFNWQDHVHVNDDKEKTATDEQEFEAEQSSLLKYHPNPLHFTTQSESSKEIQKQEKLRNLLTSYESHIREIAGLNKSNTMNQTGLDFNIDKTANQKHDITINEDKKRKYRRILGIISKIVDAIDPDENKENDMQNKTNEVSRTELQKHHNNTNYDILNVTEDEKLTSSGINASISNSSSNMYNATKFSNYQSSEQNGSEPSLSNNLLDGPDTFRNNSENGKENKKNMSSNFQHTSKQRVTEQHKPFKDKQQFPIEKPYKKPKQNKPPTISSNQLPNQNTGKSNSLQNSGQLSTQQANWQQPLQTISTVVSPAQSSNPNNQVIILNPNNHQSTNQQPEIAYTISNMKPGSYFQPELSNPQYHNVKISPILQPPTPLVGTPLFHKPTHLLIPIGYPNTMAATQRPQPLVETSLEEQISHPPLLYPVTGKIANEYIEQSQFSNNLRNLLNSDEESQYFNRNKSLDVGDDDVNINLDDHLFSQVGNGNIKEYTRRNNDVDYDTSSSIFPTVQPGTIVENFIQPQRDRIQDQILLNLNPLQSKTAPTIQSQNLFPDHPHIDPESHQFDHLGRHHHFLHHHQKLSPYTTNLDGSINILPYRHGSHHKINGGIDHHRHNHLHAITPDVDTQGNLLIPDFSHLKDQQTSVMVMGNKVQSNQPKGQSQEHIHLTVKDPQGAHLHFDHVRPYSKTNKPITIPIKVPTTSPSTTPFNPGKYHYLNLNTLSRKYIASKRTKNPKFLSPPEINMNDMNPLPPAVRPRPLMNSRPRPLLKPHHPPGFKSLFEHVKKQKIVKDAFHIEDEDNFQFGKRDDTFLLAPQTNFNEFISTQNETDDPISWAKEMLMKENINAKMLRSRKRIPHAWTENKFAPRKGIPFHRSGHNNNTNNLKNNKNPNNHLTTNISNSNLTNDTVKSKHFNVSPKIHKRHHHHRRQHHHTRPGHKHKHRSKKLFSFNLDPETILDREEAAENNNTNNVYKQKKTVLDRFEKITKPILSMSFATPTAHKHRLIRISVMASAENNDREYKKEHIHKKTIVKKIQNHNSPIFNTTKSVTDFDIMSLDLEKSKKRGISHLSRKINLNDDDETTVKLASDEKDDSNSKTVTSTEENDDNYIYKDNESEIGHKGTIVEEENFPKFISVSDFKFSDLPKLPEGKSYVLSTPKQGMCVSIIW